MLEFELIEIIGMLVVIVCLIDGLSVFVLGIEIIRLFGFWLIVVLISCDIVIMLKVFGEWYLMLILVL